MPLPTPGAIAPGALDEPAPLEQPGPPDTEMQRYYTAYQRALAAGDQGSAQLIHDSFIAPKEEERRQGYDEQAGQDRRDPDAFMAGLGHGISETAMDVRDLTGIKKPSEEEWQKFNEESDPVLRAKDAGLGDFVGGAVSLAPVGLGAEGLVERAGGLLPRAMRALSGPTARAIVSGGAEGAVAGGPNNHLEGALQGGAGAGFLSRALGAAGKVARGQVPTPEARLLESKGVRLTPGQRGGPGSWLNSGEQVAESAPFVGDSMKSQRGVGRRDFESAIIREGTAPGATPADSSLPRAQRVQDTRAGFRVPYSKIGQATVLPEVRAGGTPMPFVASRNAPFGAFDRAIDDPEIWPDGRAANEARAFVSNQLNKLPGQGRSLIAMDAQRLVDLRSSVREQATAFEKAGDIDSRKRAQMLRNVEDVITQSLQEQLPPDLGKLNREADRQYAKFSTVERAVGAAKDREVVTPNDLSNAIAAGKSKQKLAGYQSDLRDLAVAGHRTLDATNAPTGQRLLGAPAGLAALVANVPGISSVVKGQTAPQAGYRWLEEALRAQAGRGGRAAAARILPQALGAAAAMGVRHSTLNDDTGD